MLNSLFLYLQLSLFPENKCLELPHSLWVSLGSLACSVHCYTSQRTGAICIAPLDRCGSQSLLAPLYLEDTCVHPIRDSLICTTHTLWHAHSVTRAQLVLSMVPVIGRIVTSALQIRYKTFTTHRPHASSQIVTTRAHFIVTSGCSVLPLPTGLQGVTQPFWSSITNVVLCLMLQEADKMPTTASACGEKEKCPDNDLRVLSGTASCLGREEPTAAAGASEDFTPRSWPSGKLGDSRCISAGRNGGTEEGTTHKSGEQQWSRGRGREA